MEESTSANPIKELKAKLLSTFSHLLSTQSDLNADTTAGDVIKIAREYVDEHSNDPADSAAARRNSAPKRDTPGAETFSWSLWESLLKAVGTWDSEQQFDENLDRTIAFVKQLKSRPEDELQWIIWGEDTNIRSLPLVGPSMREANNGPFSYTGPDDEALARPEVQDALAGAPPSGSTRDEPAELASQRRKEWLGLQALLARLWSEVGLDMFAMSSIWAARDGLEDWPAEPPSIISDASTSEPPRGEETAAYRALLVEGAALWLRFAAPQIYASTEIWGPKGNSDWNAKQGAPGRGGARWDGVDGMDQEKKRWGVWKDVLKEVVAWYDKEAESGKGQGWKVKGTVVGALEAMDAAESK